MHPEDPKFNFELKPNITYFGRVQQRSEIKTFGILDEDRRKHMYILGKTGMGKSTLLENLIVQDIYNDKGLAFLDPHGDSSEYIIKRIPERRLKDLVYLNPSDLEFPMGLNILEATSGEDPYLVVSGLMQIFAHIWAGSWSSRMEYILSNTLFALLEVPDSTLLGVVRMLSDNEYKEYVVSQIKNPTVKNFWIKEYAAFNDKYRTEAVAPILNKIGQFFSSEITLNMMGQQKSTINFRDIMDSSKILIINLSKGKVGETAIGLIGSMLITKLQLAAMSRVNLAEADRKDFFLYVDEFQNFTTESFATILSEARKYRLCLTLAHQYIKQLEESDNEKVKNAVFGNVGTMMTFAIGAEDAIKMEQEFEPIFTAQNLVNLSKHQLALKLGIMGKPSTPFLAQTMAPILPEEQVTLQRAIDVSRENWTRPLPEVQAEIGAWMSADFGDPNKGKKNKSQFAHLMGVPGPERPPRDEGYAPRQDRGENDARAPRNDNRNDTRSDNRSDNRGDTQRDNSSRDTQRSPRSDSDRPRNDRPRSDAPRSNDRNIDRTAGRNNDRSSPSRSDDRNKSTRTKVEIHNNDRPSDKQGDNASNRNDPRRDSPKIVKSTDNQPTPGDKLAKLNSLKTNKDSSSSNANKLLDLKSKFKKD
jgi:hypothetical protein